MDDDGGEVCDHCNGTGWLDDADDVCSSCDGCGWIDRRAIAESIETDRQVDAMREARAFGDVW